MLLNFSVENYLSFKSKASLDFIAASIKEYSENVFHSPLSDNLEILKSIGVFGHNASGKSNMIKAISFMRDFVLNSSKEINTAKQIPFEPFLLSFETDSKPTIFEVVFLLDDIKYRYGFSLKNRIIESEWLFASEKRKEENLFVRAGQNFSFEKKFKSSLRGKFELLYEMTKSNTLFLSILAQFNFTMCLNISNWFSKIIIAHDTDHLDLIHFTANLMAVGDYRKLINEVIRKSDLGIDSIEEHIKDSAAKANISYDLIASVFANDIRQYTIRTGHLKYKDEKPYEKIFFELLKNESLGTQKFFGILGPLIYAIKEKSIICIDEIDARMHSHLLYDVIGLFNSKKTNSNGAQLIFTSHNTNILKKGLRRDQIYLSEKDKYSVSSIESLHVKRPQIRKDATFDKDYLSGKYGSVPGLGEGSQLNLFDGLN